METAAARISHSRFALCQKFHLTSLDFTRILLWFDARTEHDNPETNMIKSRNLFAAATVLAAAVTANADTIITGGPVSGTWNAAGSPYIVQSNITVVPGTQLTIEPSVIVRFQAGNGIKIWGSLVAVGTPTNPILFTSDQTIKMPGSWAGISATSSDPGQASVRLSNCQVEYATDGIYGYAKSGYYFTVMNLIIESTAVRSCSGYGIIAVGSGSSVQTRTSAIMLLSINGCNIYSNGLSGIRCVGSYNASLGYVRGAISNSAFFKNGQHAVSTWADSALGVTVDFSNNVMWQNASSGIDMWGWLYNTIRNNIIVSNAVGISGSLGAGYPPSVFFNDVWGNGANWGGNAAPYATAVGNISVNPLCANPEVGDFHLRSQAGRYDPSTATWVRDTFTSPCIDAGDPSSAWASEPPPNGGRINMGVDGNTPFASKSIPRVRGVTDLVTSDFVLSWGCAPTEAYTVLYSSSPIGPWLDDLPGCQLTAGPSQTVLSYTNTNGGTLTNRFYRVRWNTQ